MLQIIAILLYYIIILFICVRYNGQLSVDAVTDWFATTVLSLPRISYYSMESLVILVK